jgi:enamine deaminase RidA (YjgF/YER057c/UK114 family)
MKRETINPPGLAEPRGYAHVTIVPAGKHVYISGQVALDKAGNVVGKGDLAAQAEQVYKNLGDALAAAGASFADVFKLVTYVVDITPDKVAAERASRAKAFGTGPFPSSTMVGVTGLVIPDLLLEVEAVAAIA